VRLAPHPVHGSVVVGGCRPPSRIGVPFGTYLGDAAVAIPASLDLSSKAMASLRQVYLNNRLGCCTIAAKAHEQGVWTGQVNATPDLWTDDQIQAQYSRLGNYEPGDASTDHGCDPCDVLDACCKPGFFPDGSECAGWVQLNTFDPAELQRALFLFEGADVCVYLNDAWIASTTGDGFTWDESAPGDLSDGHCVDAYGYDSTGLHVCSWGFLGTITYAALQQPGMVGVLLSPEVIARGQTKAPTGLDWAALQADLQAIKNEYGTTPGESEFAS